MFGPELGGARLTLRPPAIGDIRTFRRWLGDPDVNRYWWTRDVPWARRPTVAALVLFIGALRPTVFLWTIEHERKPIGLCLIRQIDRRNRQATAAVLIGEPTEQGKGFAGEAMAIRNEFVFGRLGLSTLRATALADNVASRRLLERSGYRLIGTAREPAGRGKSEVLLFELLRSDYEHHRAVRDPSA